MDAHMTKTPYGLVPADPESQEWFEKIKLGQIVRGEFRKVRNYEFHKKLFSLLNFAYEYFDPEPIDSKFGKVQKNFDTFRKNVTVLAGYGEPVFNIDGTFKVLAKSISFASMSEEEFSKLYQATLTVLMDRVLSQKGFKREEVEDLTEQFLNYA